MIHQQFAAETAAPRPLPSIWLADIVKREGALFAGDIRHDIDGYMIRLLFPPGRTKEIKTAPCILIR